MSSNQNHIATHHWSNPASELLYRVGWPDEPDCKAQHEQGRQCGGCSFFAAFNQEWGLCTHASSRHHLETVLSTSPVHSTSTRVGGRIALRRTHRFIAAVVARPSRASEFGLFATSRLRALVVAGQLPSPG